VNGPDSDSVKDEAVDTFPKCKQRRPLLLGEDLDAAVQKYMETQRAVGTDINSTVVMAAAEGIISVRDVSKLVEYGGHINITKSWALNRMGYVKRKRSTSALKILLADFEEAKDVFITDVAAEQDIHKDLVLNWDQTGLSIYLQ